MSLVAIFKMTCCNREIVHGRFCGHELSSPVDKICQFGCEPTYLFGKNIGHKLIFVRYEDEHIVYEELMATWEARDRSGDLWSKYNSEKSGEDTVRKKQKPSRR